MIRYSLAYPSRVDINQTGYPDSKARDLDSPGTGTPCDERWVGDMWGAMYAILADGGFEPNEVPESLAGSQVLDAIKAIAARITADTLADGGLVPYAPEGQASGRINGQWAPVPAQSVYDVKLDGSTAPVGGETTEYTITNYHVFSTYGVTVPDGYTGTVAGPTVSITVPVEAVPGESFEFTVTRDGVGRTLTATVGSSQIVPLVWSALPRGLNSGIVTQIILALAHNGSVVVSGQSAGYASRSVDLGETWSALPQWLNSGAGPGFNILSLATSGDNFVAGLNAGYASLSTDEGVTWSALPQGLNSGGLTNITAIAASGDTFVAVCAGGWAARSTDGGVTWSALPQGLSSGTTITTDFLAIAASGDTFVAGLTNGFASLSVDGGITWSALPRGLNSGGLRSLTALAASGDVFVAGFDGGWAARSDDKGVTWTALPQDLNSGGSARDAKALAASNDVFVSGWENGYASLSTDGGATWVALPQWLNSGTMSFSITSLAGSAGSFVSGLGSGYASRSIGS